MRTSILVLTVLALVTSPLSAQDRGSTSMFFDQPARLLMAPDEAAEPDSPEAAPVEMPWLIPHSDYSGDLWTRPALTGDWGGLRQKMMDKGLRFDVSLVQTLQRNLGGGRDYRTAYSGGMDFGLQLDTGKAGLWPGGLLVIRGEARYGDASNPDSGALMPVNSNALFPVPGQDTCALSDFNFTQFLAPWVGVTFGKYSPREANVFAHDETSQFMNTAFFINPVAGMAIPLGFLGAGVLVRPTDSFNVMTLVLDSEGETNASGFDTAFDRGVSVLQVAELGIKPCGLPGHQRVGWTWSDRVRMQLQQNPRAIIGAILTGNPGLLSTQGSDWSLMYDFDQYVYTVPDKPDRGIGLFGRFGFSDGDVNPIEAFYSVGVGGKGMISGRDNDTFGLGYYYLALSDDLPRMIRSRAQDEQGVELYYNIEVTPWLHITPDIQIIDPARKAVDTTVVAGVRVKIDF
ncbi:Porin B [subsurface metagenome]